MAASVVSPNERKELRITTMKSVTKLSFDNGGEFIRQTRLEVD